MRIEPLYNPFASFHFSSYGRGLLYCLVRLYFYQPIKCDIFLGRFFEIGEVWPRVTKNRKTVRGREKSSTVVSSDKDLGRCTWCACHSFPLSLFSSPRLSHQTSAIGVPLFLSPYNKNAYVLSTSPSFFVRPAVHLPSKTTSFRSGTLTSLLRLLDLRAPFLHPSTNFYLFFFFSLVELYKFGWGGGNERRNRKKS